MYLYHYTYNFFHNNRPGKPLPGHSSFFEPFFGGLFFCGKGVGRTDDPPVGRLPVVCGSFGDVKKLWRGVFGHAIMDTIKNLVADIMCCRIVNDKKMKREWRSRNGGVYEGF